MRNMLPGHGTENVPDVPGKRLPMSKIFQDISAGYASWQQNVIAYYHEDFLYETYR